MKKFYKIVIPCLVLFSLSIGFSIYIQHSGRHALNTTCEQWDERIQKLQTELDGIHSRIEDLKKQKTESDSPELEPRALIERFQKMKDWSEVFNKKTSSIEMRRAQCHDQIREAFFIFRGLQNQRERSLNAIRDYLAGGHNVILYKYEKDDTFSFKIKDEEYKMEAVPETSRLGMIYTLGNIKTPSSFTLLCQIMQGSIDVKEIVSAGNILLAVNREEFIQLVLSVYKTRFPDLKRDEQNMLLAYFRKFSEEDYKDLLSKLSLYDENGKLDIDTLRRKVKLLGEGAVSEAYEAFNRSDADLQDKLGIFEAIKDSIGQNEQVNSIFISLVNGFDGLYKDTFGSITVWSLVQSDKKNGDPQQYLNLLDQLTVPKNEQSFFAETVELMRDYVIQRGEYGADFNETEYRQKIKDSGYSERFINRINDIIQEHPDLMDQVDPMDYTLAIQPPW